MLPVLCCLLPVVYCLLSVESTLSRVVPHVGAEQAW